MTVTTLSATAQGVVAPPIPLNPGERLLSSRIVDARSPVSTSVRSTAVPVNGYPSGRLNQTAGAHQTARVRRGSNPAAAFPTRPMRTPNVGDTRYRVAANAGRPVYRDERERPTVGYPDVFRDHRRRHEQIAWSDHPAVAKQLASNLDWIRRGEDLDARQDWSVRHYRRIADELDFVRDDMAGVQEKLERYGVTPTIGLFLRHRRRQLSSLHDHREELTHSRRELAAVQDVQVELSLRRQDLRGVLDDFDGYLASLPEAATMTRRDVDDLHNLLHRRSAILDDLIVHHRDYAHGLNDLDTVATRSRSTAAEYRTMIDRQITWIRSGPTMSLATFGDAAEGVGEMFASRGPDSFGRRLGDRLNNAPVLTAAGAAMLLILALLRMRLKYRLGTLDRRDPESNHRVPRPATAAAMTLGIASAIPVALALFAIYLTAGPHPAPSLAAMSAAFSVAALALWLIEGPRQACRAGGWLDRHVAIRFPERPAAFRLLTLAAVTVAPLAGLVAWTATRHDGLYRDGLGRLATLALLISLGYLAHRVTHPATGLVKAALKKTHDRWAYRMRHVWYVASMAAVVVPAALIVAGYGFTAESLLLRMLITAATLTAVAVVVRVSLIGGRHLWSRYMGLADDPTGGDVPIDQVAAKIDAERHAAMTRQLASLGRLVLAASLLWAVGGIWRGIVSPSLMINPIVWTLDAGPPVIDAAGYSVVSPPTEIRLGHVALALGVLFLTIQVVKTLPLAIDVIVLDHVVRDEPITQVLTAAGRVILLSVGACIAASLVGLRWADVQWLCVAAVIGLGFGSADAMRNVLGGLVVMYERPADIGQRVTVGKLTGRVSACRLRTTVLTDDEGREVIVPNRRFMSDEVIHHRETRAARAA